LRQHLAPFGVALGALTLLMLGQQIAKQLPGLLGKGLPSSEIVEVFVLSVPFVVAVTLPMAVLIAVLRVFTRVAVDGEITAMKAGGVSVLRLITPALGGAACVATFTFLWNDQILPRSNHRLRSLQVEIQRTTASVTPSDTYKSDREMTIRELRHAARSARDDADRAVVDGREAMERAARQRAAMYEVEIQKKYAIAAACLVFALFGAQVGLRFPGRGVGLVVGVSTAMFPIYYAGLIGGEELGDRLIVSPFFAMWTSNLIVAIVGLVALLLIRRPASASLAGDSATQRSLQRRQVDLSHSGAPAKEGDTRDPRRDSLGGGTNPDTKPVTTSVATLPRAVKIAAWILAGHGAAILLYAVLLQRHFNSQPDFSGAASRFLSMGLVAWALLNRTPWAWWAGVVLAGFLLILCLLAVIAVVALAEGERETLPPGYALFFALSAVAFATVVALLLAPSSRAAFRHVGLTSA